MPNFSGIWTINQQAQAKGQGIWPTPPNAPTIGTATATGATTATVAFTAPANVGYPAPITGYTATSSPGGITATGTTSPITVTGLTINTAYTFTVTATNATGTGPASAASNSVTPSLPAIGSAYGGGYFAGQINVSGTVYNLVVSDKTVGQVYQYNWGPNSTTTGITSVIDGPTNSASLAALGGTYAAATFCEGLNTGGFTDWYLPSKNELEVLYYFLKPTTGSNDTASGSNANAVSPEPISTNYTTGSPAQTSAVDFTTSTQKIDGVQFSSTETGASTVLGQDFSDGSQYTTLSKTYAFSFSRAIRRVLA